MYQPTLVNRRNVPGGAECTVIIVDDANNYPTVRQEMQFAGKTAAQLTLAFLTPFVKALAARTIQETLLRRDNAILDTIVSNRWQIDVVPALTIFDTNVNNRLAANNIDATSIQARIVTAFTNYNVLGAINNPTVTITLNHPQSVEDQINASN